MAEALDVVCIGQKHVSSSLIISLDQQVDWLGHWRIGFIANVAHGRNQFDQTLHLFF